jgi:hypothetical protein
MVTHVLLFFVVFCTHTNSSTGDGLRELAVYWSQKNSIISPLNATKWLTPQHNSEAILAVRLLVYTGLASASRVCGAIPFVEFIPPSNP